MLDVPSEVHVVLGIPGKECAKGKGKRVHINLVSRFTRLVQPGLQSGQLRTSSWRSAPG